MPVARGTFATLTVPNGTLFVRRDGKPHFSGNCYLSFGEDAGFEGGKMLTQRSGAMPLAGLEQLLGQALG